MVVILPRLVGVALMATTAPSMRAAGFRSVSPRFQRLPRVELQGPAVERSAGQRDPDRSTVEVLGRASVGDGDDDQDDEELVS
jgi:hypothetical protein